VGFEDVYRPRNPEENPLYGIVAGNLESFLAQQREHDRKRPRSCAAFADSAVSTYDRNNGFF